MDPGGVTLPDGTRLIPATTTTPTDLTIGDVAWQSQTPQTSVVPVAKGQEWYFQNSGPNGPGWYFFPGRGPSDLAYGAPKAFSASNPMGAQTLPGNPQGGADVVDLSRRSAIDTASPTAGQRPDSNAQVSDQMLALKAYADMLDKKSQDQQAMLQQIGGAAMSSVGASGKKANDALAVDPELALIQASINPRTGKPRQRASEISRSVGLSMIPAGTILHLRNVSRIETQLGGTCLAILEQDVWDAQMRAIVLPRGSRVLGNIQQVGGEAQDRAAVVFRQIVDPNGDQVPLLVEQPAMNSIGMTGIEGAVNNHFGVKFGSALAWGLISGVAGSGSTSAISPGAKYSDVVQSNVSSSFGQIGQTYLQQMMSIKADIEVAENTAMKVIIGAPIYLKAWREVRPF